MDSLKRQNQDVLGIYDRALFGKWFWMDSGVSILHIFHPGVVTLRFLVCVSLPVRRMSHTNIQEMLHSVRKKKSDSYTVNWKHLQWYDMGEIVDKSLRRPENAFEKQDFGIANKKYVGDEKCQKCVMSNIVVLVFCSRMPSLSNVAATLGNVG